MLKTDVGAGGTSPMLLVYSDSFIDPKKPIRICINENITEFAVSFQ